jgi:pyridoxine 4-dehydrogenase
LSSTRADSGRLLTGVCQYLVAGRGSDKDCDGEMSNDDGSLGFATSVSIGSDVRVGRIGYGSFRLAGPTGWGEYPDHEFAKSILRTATDLGVTFIDTADVYGPHFTELLIRDALYPYSPELVIATKGGYVRGGYDLSTLEPIGNRNYLRQCAHMSARRLGVEQIDLYYLHSGRATDASFEEQVVTLAELREQGLIRHLGLSNVTVDQFRLACTIVEIAAVTGRYNVAARNSAQLLVLAEQFGAIFSPWEPLSLGDAATKERVTSVVETIGHEHGVSGRQIALAWLLHRSPITLPIPGTTCIAHLRENLEAATIRLSDPEMKLISRLIDEQGAQPL